VYSITRKWKTAAAGMAVCALVAIFAPALAGDSRALAGPPATAAPRPRRPRVIRPHPPISLPPGLDIPHYPRGPSPFLSGETLVYDASWEGVPAAEVRIVLARPIRRPESWTGQMWLNSGKIVGPLYRMRDYFREDFSYQTWRPSGMLILQHENRRQDEWRVTFSDGGRLVTSVKKNRDGRTWTRQSAGGEPWGPFSGAMMALSQRLAPGETRIFDVFSGGNRYVFAFKVIRRERLVTALGTFDTLRIEPSLVWLSEGSFRSQASATTVWVTDDARHLPVRIESAVYIGAVRADLVRMTNGPGPDLNAPAAPPPPAGVTASKSQ
jgi:hypothetical protein